MNHPKCQKGTESFVPARLVDVGLGSIPVLQENSRLAIITGSDFKKPYVTLSHSWGPEPHLFPKLLNGENGTISEFTTKGILWKEICKSKNFAHAIQVARELGIGHIWIDSLCIIQNDTSDWNEQAPLMHRYIDTLTATLRHRRPRPR